MWQAKRWFTVPPSWVTKRLLKYATLLCYVVVALLTYFDHAHYCAPLIALVLLVSIGHDRWCPLLCQVCRGLHGGCKPRYVLKFCHCNWCHSSLIPWHGHALTLPPISTMRYWNLSHRALISLPFHHLNVHNVLSSPPFTIVWRPPHQCNSPKIWVEMCRGPKSQNLNNLGREHKVVFWTILGQNKVLH